MIEQVWDGSKEYQRAIVQALIGDSSGEMRFTATIRPDKEQPAIRVTRKFIGDIVGFLYAGYARIKALETLVVKCAEIGHLLQLLTSFLFAFSLFTFTGNGFAKTGVSIWHICT